MRIVHLIHEIGKGGERAKPARAREGERKRGREKEGEREREGERKRGRERRGERGGRERCNFKTPTQHFFCRKECDKVFSIHISSTNQNIFLKEKNHFSFQPAANTTKFCATILTCDKLECFHICTIVDR